jgi:hypothetical protein
MSRRIFRMRSQSMGMGMSLLADDRITGLGRAKGGYGAAPLALGPGCAAICGRIAQKTIVVKGRVDR